MTTPTPALGPCPRCGGKAALRQSRDGDVEWVRCGFCGHEGPVRLTAHDAIAAWNDRNPPDTPALANPGDAEIDMSDAYALANPQDAWRGDAVERGAVGRLQFLGDEAFDVLANAEAALRP